MQKCGRGERLRQSLQANRTHMAGDDAQARLACRGSSRASAMLSVGLGRYGVGDFDFSIGVNFG
jgi:hypothetical protein